MRKSLSHNLLLGELASQLRFPVGQASSELAGPEGTRRLAICRLRAQVGPALQVLPAISRPCHAHRQHLCHPSLQSDVKKRIESLIDREYLQRVEHGYEYLA